VYRYLIRQDLKKYDLSALTYCVTAGEALNAEVYNKFYEQTGIRMFEAYGQTEATVIVGNFPGMTPKPGSMGKPAPGYDVDIIDVDGKKCKAGETGEIVIHVDKGRPFGLFAGYYRDVSLTAAAFDSGLYHTGDTAYFDEDGYIWFVGRTDDIIKSSGYRISPFEVESVLMQHPSVLECAVTGVEDPKRGQLVKATIVLNKGYKPCKELEIELQDYVKHQTASYKHPRIIEFVKELPKTISGKIRRVEIREKDNGTAPKKPNRNDLFLISTLKV
ncbi:MAG: AMP-binding protein, partial [Treponema sp.]